MSEGCVCSQSLGCAFLGSLVPWLLLFLSLAIPSISLLGWGWLCLWAAGSGEESPNVGEGERRQRGAGFQLLPAAQ